MATIGTFTLADGAYSGAIKTLTLNVYSGYPESGYAEEETYTDAQAYLAERLAQAHWRMQILIEGAGFPHLLAEYRNGFAQFAGGLNKVGHAAHDPDILYSEPLFYLSQTFDALTAVLRRPESLEINGLQLLEQMLRQTPYLVADRGVTPDSEKDVRKVLYDALKIVFLDAQREIPVSHLFKTYRADLGSRRLQALVEVKYALNEAELRHELDGVYADMKGYAGDPQWRHFYAVFYTATPVASPERMLEEFKLSRVDLTWTPILVHGTGTRPTAAEKAARRAESRPARPSGGQPAGKAKRDGRPGRPAVG